MYNYILIVNCEKWYVIRQVTKKVTQLYKHDLHYAGIRNTNQALIYYVNYIYKKSIQAYYKTKNLTLHSQN